MGPFREHRVGFLSEFFGSGFSHTRAQRKYKTNKAQLLKAFEICSREIGIPVSRLGAFQNMIEDVKKIPDLEMRAKLINIWVNTAIAYDHEEAAKDLPHRTMVKALEDSMGVCDEIAQLKLAALEFAGFSAADIRYVTEIAIKDGHQYIKRAGVLYHKLCAAFGDLHAVVEVRINGKNWIMNNQYDPIQKGNISQTTAMEAAFYGSKLESDIAHMNLGVRPSRVGDYYPHDSFNGKDVFIYRANRWLFKMYTKDYAVPSWLIPEVPAAAAKSEQKTGNDSIALVESDFTSSPYRDVIKQVINSAHSIRYNNTAGL